MTKPLLWNRRTVLMILPVLLAVSCRRAQPVAVGNTDEQGPAMASTVHTGAPGSDAQLVSGFYGIEQNAWRWTAQQFSVVLRPPAGAAQKGANLVVNLTVPDGVIAKLKAISLSASIAGNSFPPETYTQPGPYTFTRSIPPALLGIDAVKVEFQLDKVMPPSNGDIRPLGIIVSSVGFEPK